MIENAPCGYLSLGANGRIEHVNRTLLGWTGHAADQMIGKRFSDFLTMAGRIYYETHIAPLLRMQGFFNEFAIDMLTADGERAADDRQRERAARSGRTTARRPSGPHQGDGPAPLRTGTSERPRNGRRLGTGDAGESFGREHETSELREQFIAVLGHDLRNPLASISAGARILDRTVQSEKEHQVIAMMQTTVMRMASMIDNVLDFARGRLGRRHRARTRGRQAAGARPHQVVDELRLATPGRTIEVDFAIDRPGEL